METKPNDQEKGPTCSELYRFYLLSMGRRAAHSTLHWLFYPVSFVPPLAGSRRRTLDAGIGCGHWVRVFA